MSTRVMEEIEHKVTSTAEGDERQKAVPPTNQRLKLAQPGRHNRIHLPEQELRRRLGRLYDMAFAAANRAEQAEPTEITSCVRDRSYK